MDLDPFQHIDQDLGSRLIKYSVTQSLCNSLLGDVVLDSFNTVYRDEDSILDQTYQK